MELDELELQVKYTPAERQFLLSEYIRQNTCKGHAISRQRIFDYLASFGISISPHTLYADLDVLKGTLKMDIRFDKHASPDGAGGYWLNNPLFEPYELRLMVDSIQASKFITQTEARTISQKISKLADVYTKDSLNRTAFVADRIRSVNERVVKDADRIHEAIATDRKIEFRYFHYTPSKDHPKSYSKSGQAYKVSPYALLWNDGNYYLYAYTEKKKFRMFRVDRMERISIPLLEPREGKSEFSKQDVIVQKAKVFGMYRGEEYTVRLRARNELADAVIDQFGKDIIMIPADSEHFTFTAPVEISPPFFAWVATFGRRMKILSPEPVVEKMREFLKKAAEMYEEGKL